MDLEPQPEHNDPRICRILSLDGGGAKGFYTLGVLHEIEAMCGRPLCEVFDVIFGTSTGSIIAALLATGRTVEDIHKLYRKHVPPIMQAKRPAEKSTRLAETGKEVLGEAKFDSLPTNLGVVATRWQQETPMIFKGSPAQAHGRVATFVPGFGCTVSEAVQASCSAYPFFLKKTVKTSAGDEVELIDGGYCANNPTLYAIADAVRALGFAPESCRVVSLGCGNYPAPKPTLKMRLARKYLVSVELLQKTLEVNTASMEQLRAVLFGHVPSVRINDSFTQPEMATDMFEHNLTKLNLLRQRGRESFAAHEGELRKMLTPEER